MGTKEPVDELRETRLFSALRGADPALADLPP